MWFTKNASQTITGHTALLILFMSILVSANSWARGGAVVDGFNSALSVPEQQCYGVSMVGYDSVINSRLGVPAEHALELAYIQTGEAKSPYQPFLLKVILDAYLWYETPHAYAVKVMYNCAINSVRLHTASSELD